MSKLAFVDIGEEVEPFVLRWISRLADCYIIPPHELKTAHPDILFYGDGKSGAHRNFRDCTRVCITYENLYPDFSECDYCMAYMHLDHPRYLRMPDWAIIYEPERFLKEPGYADRIIDEPRDFCAFVASNGNLRRTRKRIEFFTQLNSCKKVNSGGRVMNNVGEPLADHYAFARKHRFYMAFENASYPGYTTEKIADGMTNGCIPIYWGDPMVGVDFNPRSFINVGDFSDETSAIRHILEVEQQPSLYRRYLDEPFFHENKIPGLFDEQRVLSFFRRILEEPRPRRKLFSLRAPLFKIHRRMQPYLETALPSSGSVPKHRQTQP
jgi:hypothetical protein